MNDIGCAKTKMRRDRIAQLGYDLAEAMNACHAAVYAMDLDAARAHLAHADKIKSRIKNLQTRENNS